MFWNIYTELCKNKELSPNAVAKILGVASGTVTAWKNGRVPHHNTLIKIADYFGVSIDYLLGKGQEEKKSQSKLLTPSFPLTPHEMSVMIAYRAQVEMQPAVDRLLGVQAEEETVTLYSAAYSKDNTPDEIITISKAEWERLKSLPFTDQDLT